MAFNGSGTFSRTNGTNSGSTVWQQDEAGSVDILSTLHDAHDQDLADGLSNTITKDGQTTVTANIPFGGFRLLNIGEATARTDAARTSQVQDGSFCYAGASSGAANVYAASITPAPLALADGMRVIFRAHQSNTGACTFNLNSLGAIAIRRGAAATALIAGSIQSTGMIELVYSSAGSCWMLTSQSQNARLDDIAGLGVTNHSSVFGNGSNLILKTPTEARTSLGAAASGVNTDITAVNGITLASWTPTVTAAGGMTTSSIAINEAKWQRVGGYIEFHVSVNLTLGGSATGFVFASCPVVGSAMNSNITFTCAATENGSAVSNPRWQYDSASNSIFVFKPGLADWVLGANASFHIQGKYSA
jgi:hypothetical protein